MTKKIASAKLLNLDLVEMPAIKVPIYSGGVLKFKSPLKKNLNFLCRWVANEKVWVGSVPESCNPDRYAQNTPYVYFVETHFWFVASAASAMANTLCAANQAYNHAMCINKQ